MSSSSKSTTGSDSLSDSDSDLSGSSSMSSTSESNSHSSFSTSFSNTGKDVKESVKVISDSKFSKEQKKCSKRGDLSKNVSEHSCKGADIFHHKYSVMKSQKSTLIKQESKNIMKPINPMSRKHSKSKSLSRSPFNQMKVPVLVSSNIKASETSNKIYIGKLTRNITRVHIQEIFSSYGKIKNVDFPLDHVTGFNQGYSYVEFYNTRCATDAFHCMDEGYLDGQIVSVRLTHSLNNVGQSHRNITNMNTKYTPRNRNWSPKSLRKPISVFRKTRSPDIRRPPARFRRRKRDPSLSSSRSLTRSRSLSPIRHNSPFRKSLKKHSPLGKHSNSTSRYRRYRSPLMKVKKKVKNTRSSISTSSSYSSSTETR